MSISAGEMLLATHGPDQVAASAGQLACMNELQVLRRPYAIAGFGWECLDTAQWQAEYALRGEYELEHPDDPYVLFEWSMRSFDRSTERYRKVSRAQGNLNVSMCRPVYEWLCRDRLDPDTTFDFDELAVRQLDTIRTSIDTRLGLVSDESAVRLKEGTINGSDPLEKLGYIFEAMVIGMVYENPEFRDAHIIATPANPEFESSGKLITNPVDLLLWQVSDNQTITAVGGFDCKGGIDNSYKNKPLDNFSVRLRARQHFSVAGPSLQEIIETWLYQEKLEELHGELLGVISRSKNEQLKSLLGTEHGN